MKRQVLYVRFAMPVLIDNVNKDYLKPSDVQSMEFEGESGVGWLKITTKGAVKLAPQEIIVGLPNLAFVSLASDDAAPARAEKKPRSASSAADKLTGAAPYSGQEGTRTPAPAGSANVGRPPARKPKAAATA